MWRNRRRAVEGSPHLHRQAVCVALEKSLNCGPAQCGPHSFLFYETRRQFVSWRPLCAQPSMIWYFSPSLRAINFSGTQWKKSSYKEILHLKKASGFPEINNLSTVENKGERKRTDLICVLSFLVLSGFTVPLLFLLILFSSSSTSWNLAVSFDTRGAYLAKRSHLFFLLTLNSIRLEAACLCQLGGGQCLGAKEAENGYMKRCGAFPGSF